MKKINFNFKKVVFGILISTMVLGFMGCHDKNESDGCDKSSSDMKSEDMAKNGKGLEKFKTVDMDGNTVTQEIFKENKLTMVNVFSSTCNPCMGELPDLSQLAKDLKNEKVGIVGINIDLDQSGNPDSKSKEAVKKVLKGNLGHMKIIFPDDNILANVVSKTDTIPYTFFVDNNGKIVGKEILGAHSKAEWEKIIRKELKK